MHLKYPLLALALSSVLFAQQGNIEMHGKEPAVSVQTYYGKVIEILPAPPYKYLKVDENGKEIWVAISNAPVEVGDKIGYDKNTVMKNFKSKSLNREFKEVIFAFKVNLPRKQSTGSVFASMPKQPKKDIQKSTQDSKNAKAFVEKDTYTIEDLYSFNEKLNGQTVTVKGKITKISKGIMGKDWVHLEDGTGSSSDKTNDLTITSPSADVQAGDTVVVKGKVASNKDIGAGYFYKVILEEAKFSK